MTAKNGAVQTVSVSAEKFLPLMSVDLSLHTLQGCLNQLEYLIRQSSAEEGVGGIRKLRNAVSEAAQSIDKAKAEYGTHSGSRLLVAPAGAVPNIKGV